MVFRRSESKILHYSYLHGHCTGYTLVQSFRHFHCQTMHGKISRGKLQMRHVLLKMWTTMLLQLLPYCWSVYQVHQHQVKGHTYLNTNFWVQQSGAVPTRQHSSEHKPPLFLHLPKIAKKKKNHSHWLQKLNTKQAHKWNVAKFF